jgi:hypothetical protein
MLLYRLSSATDLLPPSAPFAASARSRNSFSSQSSAGSATGSAARDSIISVSDDSKYPGAGGAPGLVAYAYDPFADQMHGEAEDDDDLHVWKKEGDYQGFVWSVRGMLNAAMLSFLLLGILMLFVGYPVLTYFRGRHTIYILSPSTSTASNRTVPNPSVDRRDSVPELLR